MKILSNLFWTFFLSQFLKVTIAVLLLSNTISCADKKTSSDCKDCISKPGKYSRYSNPIYADEYDLTSQYVEMRDGVKLAIDICRPKDKTTGKVMTKPLPVLWMHTPYNRRYNGNYDDMTVECYAGTAAKLIKYGYVVATVDYRGLYGSFGHNENFNRGQWINAAQTDAYDITEWLAAQTWSNGNIGMWGCSATGGSQIQAATTAPPHLKAIFPMSFEFDVYDFRAAGGMSTTFRPWPQPNDGLTAQQRRDLMAAPVDGDNNKTLLKQAIAEHEGTIESLGDIPFRNSYSTALTDKASKQWWIHSSPSNYLNEINKSKIAMYMAVNWDEGNTKPGPFLAFNNFTVPRKLIIGPGVHCDWYTSTELTGFDILTEELRFFDYWLKGIDNGIMDEDPVYYYTYNAPKGKEWQSAKAWPLPEEKRVNFYLGEGTLSRKIPEKKGKDEALVSHDFKPNTTTNGAVIYETEVLTKDIQVTGHPTISLWVSSSESDGDFVATIQDVSPDGKLTSYNVQGQLRASMRKLAAPPYNKLGLPYHSCNKDDVQLLTPGEPTQLEFSILPISMIFKAGHKIQLAISFSGRGTPRLNPTPKVTIYRDKKHPSILTLPIVEL
ncbi:CocE/NonD family hydrolase [Wenyingzhuangia sp. chi5]|uniref:CocE/NonD family hydrolase n=1 Tax=Wenyingzhuangia gilva TaxID=3057677 RepID=A0ABT8VUB0_9FLAO|nr:CocE/NonD family hydrolase [Wenyingzhuangia sp. chi5]MDO3695565.1 CocE/NonD family hydrolase [Wenyingzhuangia sp. chi5]